MPPVNVRQLKSSSRVMLRVPRSKGRMRKQSVAVDYAGVAISGWRKTHLQHVITAAAVNLVRIADWQSGVPPAKTRCSRFAALQMAA